MCRLTDRRNGYANFDRIGCRSNITSRRLIPPLQTISDAFVSISSALVEMTDVVILVPVVATSRLFSFQSAVRGGADSSALTAALRNSAQASFLLARI
jgi:hypothetical protein